ncbi:PTS lactose/cellobiose transporter subunit IIA [Kozakia baliensis]|nr:hypothetical protein [Kozakia baliensis]
MMANDNFEPATFDGEDNKHHTARSLAEAALRAEDAGDFDKADKLMADAERADPLAAEAVLMEADRPRVRRSGAPASDEEVAALSRTVEPDRHGPTPSQLDEDY